MRRPSGATSAGNRDGSVVVSIINPELLPNPWEDIGSHGLRGYRMRTLVVIHGPCGGGHSMSLEAALELRDWLSAKIAESLCNAQSKAPIVQADSTQEMKVGELGK